MVEISQKINNTNKDAILKRYTDLGWGLKSLIGYNDCLTTLILIWSLECPPIYPDVQDLM